LTPLAPKRINLEAIFSSFKSPCVIKEFMINKVKQLIKPYLEITCCTFNNKSMWYQSCTMLPCIVAQLALSMYVTLSQVLNTNLAFWITTFVAFLTSLCMCFYHFLISLDRPMFFGDRSRSFKNSNKCWKSSYFFKGLPLLKSLHIVTN
jgi:hypothetical protein